MKFVKSLMAAAMLSAALAAAASPLAFRIDEGHNINSFLRDGPVAAHLLLRSGTEPRILVAFPAGNSGVGLWFESTSSPVSWTLVAPPKAVNTLDEQRRPLHGIEFELAVSARELQVRGAALSSIRVLRDYELQRQMPEEVAVAARIAGERIEWARNRLDGAAGYRLSLELLADSRVVGQKLAAAEGSELRLRVRALTGEAPLQPLSSPLTERAAKDTRSRNVLEFLAYQEKFLAGSWRFDTYFGRDTLISAMLLAPVLEPDAIESAITSALDRLAPNGEVAHEEDIGEFAVLRNSREGRGRVATPIYDYGMVDDDFLRAPLAARWLLDDARGRGRAQAFLSARGGNGETHGASLARNLNWLVERAGLFADDPRVAHLVGIKPGRMTGNWRDSEQGLGRGRYAYDINAALVPASLEAAARLADSALLGSWLDPDKRRVLQGARGRAQVWTAQAAKLFAVDVPAARAREAITAYAKEAGVDSQRALRSLGEGMLSFHALSLDEQGRPIPILHSDEGFRLLFSDPPADELRRCIDAIMRPFPAGLITDAGLLVTNPALAAPDLRPEFSRYAYHGTVVWSWQQALLAAGLDRQLERKDLPATMRARLKRARAELWTVINRSAELRTSELWSWTWSPSSSGGRYNLQPFGRPGADVDESNAAQLWSTVYLGVQH